MDALVEAGASVTPDTLNLRPTPLFCAVHYLALESMRVLLRRGAFVGGGASPGGETDRYCGYLLHLAAGRVGWRKGASEAVDLLLRWGADELELDVNGKTAAGVVGANQSPGNFGEEVESGIQTSAEAMHA